MDDDSGFVRLEAPKPGEWLFHFYEPGQTFEEYVQGDLVRADDERRVLVFQPVGSFSPSEQEVVDRASRFASLWFDLPSRTAAGVGLPAQGWHRLQRMPWRDEPIRQYRTRYFLEKLLPKRIPPDAVCLLAVTMADLYPEENLAFVFGQASFSDRIGVLSLARYFPDFWGTSGGGDRDVLPLRRACRVFVHEIGHMFGLAHCIYYQCVMNGSNSLEESDRRPLRLCPVCLKKLEWNRGFDRVARYERLHEFLLENGLEEEAAWIKRRLERRP